MNDRLRTWRHRERLTLREAGARFGVDARTFQRWETGERLPDKMFMVKFAAVTGGVVQPGDFYDIPAPKRRAPVRRAAS